MLDLGAGVWEVSTLRLKSGVHLHLGRHTVLQATTNIERFPVIATNVVNAEQAELHLIYAEDAEDIAIVGEGTVDGQDTAFWSPVTREEDRPYGIFDFTVQGKRLSPLVEMVRCRRVRVEGVTFQRSPGWTLHLFGCDEALISQVRIRNHLKGPNTDGLTINGCRDVRISDCDVRCGDDAINVKATNADQPTERVLVTNCIAESNCSCFGTGADVEGVIRDVTFTNCASRGALRMIQVGMWYAGLTENICFHNIVGNTLPGPGVTGERAIYVDIQQWRRQTPDLGRVRNCVFS